VVKEEMELDLECDVVLGKESEKKKGPERPKELEMEKDSLHCSYKKCTNKQP
jgi:hypothetical protein